MEDEGNVAERILQVMVKVKEEPNDSVHYSDGLTENDFDCGNATTISLNIKSESNFDSLRNFRHVKHHHNLSTSSSSSLKHHHNLSSFEDVKKKEFEPPLSSDESSHFPLSTEDSVKRTIENVIKMYTSGDIAVHKKVKVKVKNTKLSEYQNKLPTEFSPSDDDVDDDPDMDSIASYGDVDPAFVCSDNPLPVKCIIEEAPQNFPSDECVDDEDHSDDFSNQTPGVDEIPLREISDESIALLDSIKNCSEIKIDPNSNPFACPDCFKVLSSAGNLRRHVNTKHRGMKPFMCPQCFLAFGEKASLEKHVMAIHDKIRPFRCSECEKSCVTKSSLVKHIQTNHATIPAVKYECSICKGERNFTRSGFRMHWLKNHESDPDTPEEIRKRCSDRKFKCPLCPTRFGSRPAVNTHVLTKHEGARPFGCPLCNASFSSKNHIKRHIDATHKKLRPYECTLCAKRFSYKSFLQRHISHTHLGVKEYECQVCQTCFSEKANMLRHIDMVHKQLKPFACQICDSKYCDKAGLKHHLNSKHGISSP